MDAQHFMRVIQASVGFSVKQHVQLWSRIPEVPYDETIFVYKIGHIGSNPMLKIPIKPSGVLKFRDLIPFLSDKDVEFLTDGEYSYQSEEPIMLPVIHYRLHATDPEADTKVARASFKMEYILSEIASGMILGNMKGMRAQIVPFGCIFERDSINPVPVQNNGMTIAYRLFEEFTGLPFCYNCGSTGDLTPCSRCKKVNYCSIKCFKEDFDKFHMYSCSTVVEENN